MQDDLQTWFLAILNQVNSAPTITEKKTIILASFLPNFKIIRKDRDKAGGGVAIAIRKNIPFHIISLPIFNSLEIIGISLKINNSPYISNTALNELHLFIQNQSNFLIIGDLNSKNPYRVSNTTNQNGRRLYRIITQNHLTIHSPFAPTHHNKNNSFDLLDFGLSKNPHNIYHPLQHFAIPPQSCLSYQLEKYAEFLCNKPNLLTPTAPNPKDISSQISKLNQLIFEAMQFSQTPNCG
ncbi:hypothetical protein J437_LFUL010288 [Ladona fulva]|uniref:Endonuclease/exonuclease/phosphatase domain-containing protein n=1 Tax=Ladona fulva TaxID=123851 RepID=A0A8K0KB02_LADFU|nr:hypothetical protein J437_LFUL010288 [Ladona fulva]